MIINKLADFKYEFAPGHAGTVGGMRAESGFCLVEQSMMLPGAGSEWYTAQNEHFYIILEGHPTVYIKDKEEATLDPMDVVHFQAGDVKRIENCTNEPVKLLVLIGKRK